MHINKMTIIKKLKKTLCSSNDLKYDYYILIIILNEQ